ncbi:hypothetical protein AN191_03080 [Loktanella sp. 5RATIMAR09]|uniref:hypothetical protein n=1 Tax=Loktanella sp. 5RATIMAR09 TaxID=1225655 RepID=UPI0007072F57|nr:hypothetical protein [Loktanella sp. 5RATIMAR09]KQI72914.1 hypothetical protein AN191_03080 [Loktanella sp. 5RATIMAR09]
MDQFQVPPDSPHEPESFALDGPLCALGVLAVLGLLGPLGSLGVLGALGSLGALCSLGALAGLLADGAEAPSEACAIDIVVKAGTV